MKSKETRNDLERRINMHAWKDPKFKDKLMNSPKECLTEFGLTIPAHSKIIVHDEDQNTWHLVIRPAPPSSQKLSEEELQELAAGECCGSKEWGTG